jgi:hypothetical protein
MRNDTASQIACLARVLKVPALRDSGGRLAATARDSGCCPALRMPMWASLMVPMSVVRKAPPPGRGGGALRARRRLWWARRRVAVLVVGDFGDGRAGGGFVDDGLAAGEGGDESGDGEVVDGPGVAAGGGVDERGGIVAEQGVGAPGFSELEICRFKSSVEAFSGCSEDGCDQELNIAVV